MGSLSKSIRKALAAALSFVGDLAAVLSHAGGVTYQLLLTASVGFIGAISKRVTLTLEGTLGTSGDGIGPRIILIRHRLAMRIKGIIYEYLS